MAKNKKRGFFSWLGLGRDEAESQPVTKETPEDQQSVVNDETDATTSARDDAIRHPAPREAATEKTVVEEATQHPQDVSAADEPEPTDLVEIQPELPELAPVPNNKAPEADVATSLENTRVATPASEAFTAPQPEQLYRQEHDVSGHPAEMQVEENVAVVPTAGEQIDIEESVTAPTNEIVEQQRPSKEGFFARLKRSLVKTRQNLGSGFIGLFRGKKIDDDLFEELEEQLLIADVGVETTRRIITHLTQQANRKQLRDAEALYGLLKQDMSDILAKVESPLDMAGKTPFVILMVGVNGVGKTTTIGKLARQYQAEGKSVMLAAGDTFRAAAVEQLQVWGQRNNIPVVAQHTGADSASVIFDAIQAAKARHVDVLIADTAGRLQNKSHLMEELKKNHPRNEKAG